jgi:hypothetical protein
LVIELHQRTAIRCLIADFERTLEGPLSLYRPAGTIDGTQRILQTFGIARSLSNADVCH